jgi:hypothetical protein
MAEEANDHSPPEEEPKPVPEGSESKWTGIDELLASIGATLNSPKGKDAIAALIKAYADNLPKRAELAMRSTRWAYTLAGVAVVVIGVLGYCKVITSETTGTLMGTIVAALFYRRNSN